MKRLDKQVRHATRDEGENKRLKYTRKHMGHSWSYSETTYLQSKRSKQNMAYTDRRLPKQNRK